MKTLDYLFLLLSLFLTAATAWAVLTPSNSPLRVEIQTDKTLYTYPLTSDEEVAAQGPLGVTHVSVTQGKVWVEDSPCTNKVCVAMGVIRKSGQWLACLPNHVFVRITGGGTAPDGIDVRAF